MAIRPKRKNTPKKHFKGLRYINYALVRYYSKRYGKYSDATSDAKRILEELKKSGKKVTIKNIRELNKKAKKQVVPQLDDKLIREEHYWNLTDYPSAISRMLQDPPILFESKIIPEGLPDLMSGFDYNYSDYFSSFVNYIDKEIRPNQEKSVYETEWFVKCETPVWDRSRKVWVSQIISCDSDGTMFDYGFNPIEVDNSTPPPPNTLKGKEKEEPKTEQPKQPASEVDGLIRLEKAKQKTQLNEMLLRGILTKEEYKDEVKKLEQNG